MSNCPDICFEVLHVYRIKSNDSNVQTDVSFGELVT